MTNSAPLRSREFLSYVSFYVFLQLFERTPIERLGYKEGTNPNIRDHKFFERINWANLEERKITPPFKPSVVSELLIYPQIVAVSGTLTLRSLVPPLMLSSTAVQTKLFEWSFGKFTTVFMFLVSHILSALHVTFIFPVSFLSLLTLAYLSLSRRLQTMTPRTSILISQWRFPNSLQQTKICFSLWIKDNFGASHLSIRTLALSTELPTCTIISELYILLSHSQMLLDFLVVSR